MDIIEILEFLYRNDFTLVPYININTIEIGKYVLDIPLTTSVKGIKRALCFSKLFTNYITIYLNFQDRLFKKTIPATDTEIDSLLHKLSKLDDA